MSSDNRAIVVAGSLFSEKQVTLIEELSFALRQIEPGHLAQWGGDVVWTTAHVGARRVKRAGTTIWNIGDFLATEVKDGYHAATEGTFTEHAQQRAERAASATREGLSRLWAQGGNLVETIKSPEKMPEAVVTVVAALVTSGGIDANGGLPDLDLALGIDAHRSIFTHSIIAGTVVEGSLYGVATLMGLAHSKLPASHDAIWDAINVQKDKIVIAVTQGMSAGLAYHLMVDGLIQEGAYHGIPVPMSQELHDAIATVNGLVEARDVDAKKGTFLKAGKPEG